MASTRRNPHNKPSQNGNSRGTRPFRHSATVRSVRFCDTEHAIAREHIDRDHPEMQRTDEQVRERVAADAYDLEPAR